MKKYINLFITCIIFNACTSFQEEIISSKPAIKFVSVQSYNLIQNSDNYFVKNIRTFNKNDNAIGNIQESNSGNNAIQRGKEVIVFEGIIPSNVLSLSKTELNNLFEQTNWVQSTVYKLPIDVAVNPDINDLVFAFRTGETTRFESKINGVMAYKFENEIYIENYKPFLNLIEKGLTKSMTIDLGNALKINKMNYNISSNSDSFIIEDGILTFSKSPNRPQNNYGLIYIKPKSDELPAYRLQIFSHKIPEKLKNTYFDTNGNILNMKTYTDEYLRPILKSNSPKLLFLANYSANARIQSVEDCGPGGNCQIPPPVRYTE